MSVLAYPPTNEEEIFRHCTSECGIITATEDQQYFALGCMICSEKFLYFDAFIEHIQTRHTSRGRKRRHDEDAEDGDMTADDAHPPMLEPPVSPVVMIKEEKYEMDDEEDVGRTVCVEISWKCLLMCLCVHVLFSSVAGSSYRQ